MQNIPAYRWPPTHRLLAARFLADLEQLQNRDFSASNRIKPIVVLTFTKLPRTNDRLPIDYLLPDFQPIWRNFFASLFFSQSGRRGSTLKKKKINSYKSFDPLKVVSYYQGICFPIYSQVEATFWFTVRRQKTGTKTKFFIVVNPYEIWHKFRPFGKW